MGQYYKAIKIDEPMEYVSPWDYNNGSKLMEHSYVGNNYVGTIMQLMTKGNNWHKKSIVWCGDYFNEENEEDYYHQVENNNKIKPSKTMTKIQQKKAILVNHTTKKYLMYSKLKSEKGWIINPLPLLTALGNGKGGGDYDGLNNNQIGTWARHILSIEFLVPKGYDEIELEFKETSRKFQTKILIMK